MYEQAQEEGRKKEPPQFDHIPLIKKKDICMILFYPKRNPLKLSALLLAICLILVLPTTQIHQIHSSMRKPNEFGPWGNYERQRLKISNNMFYVKLQLSLSLSIVPIENGYRSYKFVLDSCVKKTVQFKSLSYIRLSSQMHEHRVAIPLTDTTQNCCTPLFEC